MFDGLMYYSRHSISVYGNADSMPQLTLEYTANVEEVSNLNALFLQCHHVLVDVIGTDINNCKSRAIELTNYCIGSGADENAFVHITLKVLPGRDQDTLNQLAEKIMPIVSQHFEKSLKLLKLQITLEIVELQKTYFKKASQ